MYAIAKLLTLEQRRRAAAETYTPQHPDGSYPRSESGHCALGVALGTVAKAPPPGALLWAMLDKPPVTDSPEWDRLLKLTYTFTNDFDNGRIKDVAKAMGVKKR